jgi:hypothetical protein
MGQVLSNSLNNPLRYPLYPASYPFYYPEIRDYEAAGVLFIDESHFLAGYQPKKRGACITGIGGAREEGEESYVTTAYRELFEELFGWKRVSQRLIKEVAEKVRPAAVFQLDSYVTIALSFKDLEKILGLARGESSRSPFYEAFPKTPWDLVRRRVAPADAEVQQLVLLPAVQSATKFNLSIHIELLDDVKVYFEEIAKRG